MIRDFVQREYYITIELFDFPFHSGYTAHHRGMQLASICPTGITGVPASFPYTRGSSAAMTIKGRADRIETWPIEVMAWLFFCRPIRSAAWEPAT